MNPKSMSLSINPYFMVNASELAHIFWFSLFSAYTLDRSRILFIVIPINTGNWPGCDGANEVSKNVDRKCI
jgi:hypothetical protein